MYIRFNETNGRGGEGTVSAPRLSSPASRSSRPSTPATTARRSTPDPCAFACRRCARRTTRPPGSATQNLVPNDLRTASLSGQRVRRLMYWRSRDRAKSPSCPLVMAWSAMPSKNTASAKGNEGSHRWSASCVRMPSNKPPPMNAMAVLRASAAEGIAPPPVSRRTRTSEGKETSPRTDAARNRAPLRAGVPERALLEGGDVLESSLLGTNAHNN